MHTAREESNTAEYTSITHCVNQYRKGLALLGFPQEQRVLHLTSEHYNVLLETLSSKITDKKLPHFALYQTNIAALQGLNTFYKTKNPACFETLSLHIMASEDEKEAFVDALQELLPHIAQSGVERIQLKDDKDTLKPEDIQKLCTFIQANNIPIWIELPTPYNTQAFQYQLDKATGIAIRDRNSKRLLQQASEHVVAHPPKKVQGPKRTRPRTNARAHLNIDVEMQQSVDISTEVAPIEITKRVEREDEASPDFTIIRQDEWVKTPQFTGLHNPLPETIPEGERMDYMDNLLGIFKDESGRRYENTDFAGISEAALMYLFRYSNYFQSGINTRELPAGLKLIANPQNPAERILHYDERYQEQSDFAPRVIPQKPLTALSADLTERLCAILPVGNALKTSWDSLQEGSLYQKEEHRLFSTALPEALIESSPHPFLQLLQEENETLAQKLLSSVGTYKLTARELNGLLRIYDEYGRAGLEILLQRIDDLSKIYPGLDSLVRHVDGYIDILDPQKYKALERSMQQLSGLSVVEKQWWNILYAKHQPKDDDLSHLVGSFYAFCQELTRFSPPLRLHPLGEEDVFQGAGNLPTTLGRMLSIVQQCHPKDRMEQWFVMGKIDLTAHGALRAMTNSIHQYPPIDAKEMSTCSFVVPEMAKNANPYQKLKSFFYRAIAQNKDRMPLSTYIEMILALEQYSGRLEPNSIYWMLKLLMLSLDQQGSYSFIKNIDSLEEWKSILESLASIKIPGVSTNTIIEQFYAQIHKLEMIPPLNILNKIVIKLSKPLQHVGIRDIPKLIRNQKTYEQLLTRLKTLLVRYELDIYQGMMHYRTEDYDAECPPYKDLFDSHLSVCEFIAYEEDDEDEQNLPKNEHKKDVSEQIIPLISSYKLSSDDIQEMLTTINGRFNTSFFHRRGFEYAMDVLRNIQNSSDLDANALTAFINELMNEIDKPYEILVSERRAGEEKMNDSDFDVEDYFDAFTFVSPSSAGIQENDIHLTERSKTILKDNQNIAHQLIQKHFPQAFPTDYFTKTAKELDESVKFEINYHFKIHEMNEMIQKIVTQFAHHAPEQQLDLVHTLQILYANTSSPKELLLALSDPSLLNNDFDKYTALLAAICKKSPEHFLYFFAEAKKMGDEGLFQKTSLFLSDEIPTLQACSALSTQEKTHLVVSLILDAKEEALQTTFIGNAALQYALIELKVRLFNRYSLPEGAISEQVDTITALLDQYPIFKNDTLYSLLNTLKAPAAPVTVAIEKAPEVKPSRFRRTLNTVNEWFGRSVPQTPAPVPTPVAAQRDFIKEVDEESKKLLVPYSSMIAQSVTLINQMVEHYPAAKNSIIDLCQYYLKHLPAAQAFLKLEFLRDQLIGLNDDNLVLSLCEHFGPTDQALFNPQKLLDIFEGPTFEGLPVPTQKLLLNIIVSLLNNDLPCSMDNITKLIQDAADVNSGNSYRVFLKKVFSKAPLPSLEQVNTWFVSSEDPLQSYQTWSKNPVAREAEVNGFILSEAKIQRAKLKGIDISDQELNELASATITAQTLETNDLIKAIQDYKNRSYDVRLLALTAELLYRSKGLAQLDIGAQRVYGRSFEINTTQYLALHAMLKKGTHVTSQIATGEGKSRIMMLAIACQYALGNTVDFVTSDAALAQRDYLEYLAFFKALGAETSIIYAQSPATQYKKGGINFSDAANLSLFRNKASSEGEGERTIADDAHKRSLMLDEADKTYFDSAETRFNYSTEVDNSLKNMEWIYPELIRFFSYPAHIEQYHDNVDACNELLAQYLISKAQDDESRHRLEEISTNQLEAWQDAAVTALQLKLGEDFVIKSDIKIQTKTGPKIVSQAQLISAHRAAPGAKFAFGVHQCLHARLEESRKNHELNVQHPFYIEPETQIVYSSTSKNLLDDYQEGQLLAVTGTAGAIKERVEATALYQDMAFIEVPKHKQQRRKDLSVMLAKAEEDQYRKILAHVKLALRRNQPILLIAKDDNESVKLHAFLAKNLKKDEYTLLKPILAHTETDEELDHVQKTAGKSGTITISTPRLGRGTDIKLHGDAKTEGLYVITSYLPSERDYYQIVGRAGRFGDKGTSRMILNEEKMRHEHFAQQELPTEFYTATEAYLKRLQDGAVIATQRQRLIKNHVGDFRHALTNTFFTQCFKPLLQQGNDRNTLLAPWRIFYDTLDKSWSNLWAKLSDALSKNNVDLEFIKGELAQFKTTSLDAWQKMRDYLETQITQGSLKIEAPHSLDTLLGAVQDINIQLTEHQKELLQENLHTQKPLQTAVAKEYEEAHRGRAMLYTRFTDRIRSFFQNIVAAWHKEGLWFPNLQAVWKGNMTWKAFFLGGKIKEEEEQPTIEEPKHEKKPYSTATMLDGLTKNTPPTTPTSERSSPQSSDSFSDSPVPSSTSGEDETPQRSKSP